MGTEKGHACDVPQKCDTRADNPSIQYVQNAATGAFAPWFLAACRGQNNISK